MGGLGLRGFGKLDGARIIATVDPFTKKREQFAAKLNEQYGGEFCKPFEDYREVLANKDIDEFSGLAAGRANKGVLWTHNDSGGKPRLFAINHAGDDLATLTLAGATARDWEDICSFTFKGRHFLMLGDFGDNDGKRRDCRLYVVLEPRLNTARRSAKLQVSPAMTLQFGYQDGPHNCESMGVDMTTRTIYLVSKRSGGTCKVYAMGLPVRSLGNYRTTL